MPFSGSGALIAATHRSENLVKDGDTQLSARQSPVEKEEIHREGPALSTGRQAKTAGGGSVACNATARTVSESCAT